MRFTDAHAPSAVCTPTRYALMTGQYAWRHPPAARILSGVAPLCIPKDRLTLPSLLKQAGYATGVVGKWHLGLGEAETDYNGEITPRAARGRVRLLVHHPRHRRPRRPASTSRTTGRRLRPERPDPGQLRPARRRRADRGEEPGAAEGQAEPRPRQHDRQRHQPDRLHDRRQGGPLEGRGHGRRAHQEGRRVHRGEHGQAVLPLLRHARRPRPARPAPAIPGAPAGAAPAAT